MKVTFQYGIGSFSGTVENAVFWPTLNKLGSYMRKYVVPKLTENNTLRGTIMKNLSEVWSEVSSGYKLEMKTYCERLTVALNDQQDPFAPRYTSFGIWVKMMYLFSKLDAGHINLGTITYSDLQTLGEDILSIAVAVENEYMTAVPGYDELITNM